MAVLGMHRTASWPEAGCTASSVDSTDSSTAARRRLEEDPIVADHEEHLTEWGTAIRRYHTCPGQMDAQSREPI